MVEPDDRDLEVISANKVFSLLRECWSRMDAIIDEQMSAKFRSEQIEIKKRVQRGHEFEQTSSFPYLSFLFQFSNLSLPLQGLILEQFSSSCVLRIVLTSCCRHEDRRLLRPCSFGPRYRKITLVHGCSENSIIEAFVWSWQCRRLIQGISQDSLLFLLSILYQIDTKAKNTRVMHDAMIVYDHYFTEVYTGSIDDCDDLCFTRCELHSCASQSNRFAFL